MRRRRGRLVVASRALALCAYIGVSVSAAHAATAADNYKKFCHKCHGENGSGNGPAAAVLDKHPFDFTDCEAMKARSRDYLVKIVAGGGSAVNKSPQMPAHSKKLSAEEIEALVTYVSTHFCKGD